MGGDRLVAHVAGQPVEETHGDAVRDRWEKEYDAIIEETRLFAGARDLLRACRERGLRVALASSAIPRHARHALGLLDADDLADAWTTSEDADRSKPAPDLLDEALRQVAGHAAMMVGDAVWDVEAASARGLPTVGLLTGGIGRAELLDAGAVAVYDDPGDLAVHLDQALARAGAGR
jgi:HAD superfamily hydrolase (TIGR01549 family)